MTTLDGWWRTLLNHDPPNEQTGGLWFGLFEADGGTMLYVQGYEQFDPSDETAEWAADVPSWAPDGRYVRLREIAPTDDWQSALEEAVRLVKELQPWSDVRGRLDGVAVGFDDGDRHIIWTRA